LQYLLGLNTIKRLITYGFEEKNCNELDCIAYNINLNTIVRLFSKYPKIKTVSVWSNTENILYSEEHFDTVKWLIDSGRLKFYHISENLNKVHAKLYQFKKDGKIDFLAIGSSNFTDGSNQNFESMYIISDSEEIKEIWAKIESSFNELSIIFSDDTSEFLFLKDIKDSFFIDNESFEQLWKHQQQILIWLSNKRYSIVNIPPGTGKTKIASMYLKLLQTKGNSLSSIILVPTKTLIKQWMERLDDEGIENYELETDLSSLDNYFADPTNKTIITLYSRFFDSYQSFYQKIRIMKPNILLIYDECHNSYNNLDIIDKFRKLIEKYKGETYEIGLSATIDSFRENLVEKFLNLMNNKNFEISLQSFYSKWNNMNDRPILKRIDYKPLFYPLSQSEMEEYNKYSRNIAMTFDKKNIDGGEEKFSAAIKRAQWLRGLEGGKEVLKEYFIENISSFDNKSTIIFVQTNEIAEEMHTYITSLPGWNKDSSIYIYDSTRSSDYHKYALKNFKSNLGFCLISERMLAEGFDLPKVDQVILHGSHRSSRDWIQKIGRAIRYNINEPDSKAKIIDIVFCDTNNLPLQIEYERFECLNSISD